MKAVAFQGKPAPDQAAAPPAKPVLPTDPEGVRQFIAKTHQMHGQGRGMFFVLEGPGRRATAGTYHAHADVIPWKPDASQSVDAYNLFS